MFILCWVHCFVPACARPARLHPAGGLEFESSNSLQKQGTLGREPISLHDFMSAATRLTRGGLLAGSARQRLTARQRHRPGDEFTLEC